MWFGTIVLYASVTVYCARMLLQYVAFTDTFSIFRRV